MSPLTEHLEAVSFDAEYEGPDGLIHGGPGVTLVEALAAARAAQVEAFKASAKFISDDADKWRPIDPAVAEAMDTLAASLTKHARRVRRNT